MYISIIQYHSCNGNDTDKKIGNTLLLWHFEISIARCSGISVYRYITYSIWTGHLTYLLAYIYIYLATQLHIFQTYCILATDESFTIKLSI